MNGFNKIATNRQINSFALVALLGILNCTEEVLLSLPVIA